MIKSVGIYNFKCFSRLKLNYSSLTLLTGFNSGGKSSAIQPLLLLAQGMRLGALPTKKFPLNGSLVRLGSAGDILPIDGVTSVVEFEVESQDEIRKWSLAAKAGERLLRFDSTEKQLSTSSQGEVESEDSVIKTIAKLSFIGAVRVAATDEYPLPDTDAKKLSDVGFDGRYACFEYHRAADDQVPLNKCFPGESASSFRKQVDAWMGSLFPGAQVNVLPFPSLSLFALQFRISEFGEWRRPANVGFGFSYVFPIIVALLTAKPGQLIIIDSPEAHLHPRAQSQMGRLLAHFASAGIQVVVESHSDHLLNGVRLAVRERVLPHSALSILFFSGPGKEGHGVIAPSVDQCGDIYEWPDGFFDQGEKDIARLSGWA